MEETFLEKCGKPLFYADFWHFFCDPKKYVLIAKKYVLIVIKIRFDSFENPMVYKNSAGLLCSGRLK